MIINNSAYKSYRAYTRKKGLFVVFTLLLLVIGIFVSLSFGSVYISWKEIVEALISGNSTDASIIVKNIRLPRVLAAVFAGAALSVSGTTMQSILRNPLASPVSLGISHAAAFGAAFAIILLDVTRFDSSRALASIPYAISISAFLWSMVNTVIILFIARLKGAGAETIILAGIISGSLFTAATSALQFFGDDVQVSSIVFWLFGDLGKTSWVKCWILMAIVGPATLYFIKNRWNYQVMNTGEETARSLGVKTQKKRIYGMIIASFVSAVTVAFFGVIAFVGLVVPHIVRRFTGSSEQFLIPASALFGALFLLFSDTVARTVFSLVVLPVGILTSFLGAPLFIYLLLKKMGRTF